MLGFTSGAFLIFAVYGAPYLFGFMVRTESIGDALQITRVLSIFLIFSFLSIPLSEWLITRADKKQYLILAGIAATVNLSLNVLLVPWLGVWGAAVAKVGAELAILGFLLAKCSIPVRKGALRVSLGHLVHIPAILWVLSGRTLVWEYGVLHTMAFILLTYRLGYFQKSDFRLLRTY
jgi:Na+-driven multidrug efflux pump